MRYLALASLVSLTLAMAGPAIAGSTGTVIGGGGGGGDVANPMTSDLDAGNNDITNVGDVSADSFTSSADDGSREMSLSENTSYTCSASTDEFRLYNEGDVLKYCDEGGESNVVSRVLLDTETTTSAVNDITVSYADWQTEYSVLELELIGVWCTTDGEGMRVRYDNNGVETAGDAYVGKTFHDPGVATETLVEGAALRTDTTEEIDAAAASGVTGTVVVRSLGTATNSAFRMVADWAYLDSVDEAITAQRLYVSGDGMTSFDGFYLDCTASSTINGTARIWGLQTW